MNVPVRPTPFVCVCVCVGGKGGGEMRGEKTRRGGEEREKDGGRELTKEGKNRRYGEEVGEK